MPTLLLLLVTALAAPAEKPTPGRLPTANLVVNGDFTHGKQGWTGLTGDRQLKVIDHNPALSIRGSGSINQTVALDPDWAALRVTVRMRTAEVVLGKEGWQDARLAMEFVDAQGKHLNPWPNVFHAAGSTPWTAYDRIFKIPAGAAALRVSPSMFGASGTADFDDLEIRVVRLRSGMAQDMPLPNGADDLSDLARAWREHSPTRARISLNGLWRFLPAEKPGDTPPPPARGWGWFKVPGLWPRSDDSAQEVLLPGGIDEAELRHLEQAWQQRPLCVPADWKGRQILLDFAMVQTHVRVWIDRTEVGAVVFPGGLLDITQWITPGSPQVLTVLVTARPLEKESSVFMAPERVITSKAALRCKGLTGDVWLVNRPGAERLGELHIVTSTRKGTIAFQTTIQDREPGARQLEATVFYAGKLVKTFRGAADPKSGRVDFGGAWPDAKKWDLHTPENRYQAVVALRDATGRLIDESLPVSFGFREFWIDGRDFYLNGTPVHLRSLFTTNVAAEADQASLEGCRNTCRRLKEHGFNALIASNYSFAPGDVGYLDGIFQAADEEGVLTTFSLPHVKDFNQKLDRPEQARRYEAVCAWLTERARNHPSIVMYAMNHNSTGYQGDQNPLWMDGIYQPDSEWAATRPGRLKARQQARLAAAIARRLDPTRPIYHHQSGNLGDLYTVNIYLNWAPLQERSDWLAHWARAGVKPMFFVEWGLPHISSWSSFRGPEFIWRSPAFQQIWDSEYAAAYVGQEAYRMTPTKVRSLEWEEELWARGKPFSWSQLIRELRHQDENYTQIQALFAADNWRSHRAWGISAMLPWDQENLWRVPPEAGRRTAMAQPYRDLTRPGVVPDRVAAVESQAIYSRDVSHIRPSELGKAFLRWNQPHCGFIAGAARHFTEKGHNFLPCETIRKQLAILNDDRVPVTCRYRWTFGGKPGGSGEVVVPPGGKQWVDVSVSLAAELAPGRYELAARFDFGTVQEDRLSIDILPAHQRRRSNTRIAVYDPKGTTTGFLRELGFACVPWDEKTSAARAVDLLVIGRQALIAGQPVPGLDRLASGLKLLIFEQDAEVLEKCFHLRINVHGLRQVFRRVAGHGALSGLRDDHLRDWQGAATLVPPYLDIKRQDQNDPKWKWCGFENTRVWRCGNEGAVASVLIEKPDRGNYLPLADGGFDLQYAPLLEWIEGRGRAIFCQLDVTGRTHPDPVAAELASALVHYLAGASNAETRPSFFAGDEDTVELLGNIGIGARLVEQLPTSSGLLVLGKGATLAGDLKARVREGLDVLALGLSEAEITRWLPGVVQVKTGPTVPTLVTDWSQGLLAGISNAELHWRTRPVLAALADSDSGGNEAVRVLTLGRGRIVFCQAAPWTFDYEKQPYLRTSYRRNVFLVARLLYNLGAATAAVPLEHRYTQDPQAVDDPYRYYRW